MPEWVHRYGVSKRNSAMGRRREDRKHVLRYTSDWERNKQPKVRRHFLWQRQEEGIPERCDNPECPFHEGPLEWLGKPVPLTMDHINGNPKDNRYVNLRLLCPICDAQLPTAGGKNKGNVLDECEGGFSYREENGGRGWLVAGKRRSLLLKTNKARVGYKPN